MARGEYYVWGEGGRWHVRHNGLTISFETPRVALSAALGEANKAGERGYGGRVLVQRPDGEWKNEWVYGRDPVPELSFAA